MTLRIGSLGAARIAPMALVRPARQVDGVEFTAVAARDPAKAEAFARKHGVPHRYDSYDELIENVDAVYNPLPNGLHGYWTQKALAAGKHVLCEKPFTANAHEARDIAAAHSGTGLVLMEAFHWRYHPLAERIRGLAHSELGEIRRVETEFCVPLPLFNDIRYQLDLAGGATMDTGCYAIHILRQLGPSEPRVVSASAIEKTPGIDRAMTAEFEFETGATGRISCSLWSAKLLKASAKVFGTRGTLHVTNPVAPQFFNRVRLARDGRTIFSEKVEGAATYTYQLRAFLDAVNGDENANLTPPSDSIITMSLIDDVYRAAGLEPREPTPAP
ncbi:MAG: gfo/Idh/MocA family oxidoreductase [Gammaproteobacteria bacterium]|nr:MAG: gfo/Idh/MocA family oxidoreductase [Gammaproteobacteria bacterium]